MFLFCFYLFLWRTKLIYGYNFVAPLSLLLESRFLLNILTNIDSIFLALLIKNILFEHLNLYTFGVKFLPFGISVMMLTLYRSSHPEAFCVVNFVKILRTPIFIEHIWWLLLTLGSKGLLVLKSEFTFLNYH